MPLEPPDPPARPRSRRLTLAALNRILVREAVRQAVDRAGVTPSSAVEPRVVALYVRAAARHGERHISTADLRALTAGLPPEVPQDAVMAALIALDPGVLRRMRTQLAARRAELGRQTRDLRAAQRQLARLSLAPHPAIAPQLATLGATRRRDAATQRLVHRLAAPKRLVGLTEEMRRVVNVFRQAGLTRWPACTHTAPILQRWHPDIPKDELTPRRIYDRLRHRPKPPASA